MYHYRLTAHGTIHHLFWFLFHVKVFQCLQPLMVCLSSTGTTKLIDRLGEDHDVEVLIWGDELKDAQEV